MSLGDGAFGLKASLNPQVPNFLNPTGAVPDEQPAETVRSPQPMSTSRWLAGEEERPKRAPARAQPPSEDVLAGGDGGEEDYSGRPSSVNDPTLLA